MLFVNLYGLVNSDENTEIFFFKFYRKSFITSKVSLNDKPIV